MQCPPVARRVVDGAGQVPLLSVGQELLKPAVEGPGRRRDVPPRPARQIVGGPDDGPALRLPAAGHRRRPKQRHQQQCRRQTQQRRAGGRRVHRVIGRPVLGRVVFFSIFLPRARSLTATLNADAYSTSKTANRMTSFLPASLGRLAFVRSSTRWSRRHAADCGRRYFYARAIYLKPLRERPYGSDPTVCRLLGSVATLVPRCV